MFQKLLRLLGLGPKVDAIGDELDAMRETLHQVNDSLRKGLALKERPPRAIAGK